MTGNVKEIKRHEEYQYLDILKDILENGERVSNRTGVDTIRLLGKMMKFDFSNGFPLLTTKKVWFRGVAIELLWFLSGSTNIKYLVDNGVNIWNDDSYRYCIGQTTASNPPSKEEWLERLKSGETNLGEIGPVYGKQWRRWQTNAIYKDTVVVKDQVENLVHSLKNNPSSRRHIISAWNVADIDEMGLPPCFPAGHRVRTERGYIPIEEIKQGDNVFTSEGNWLYAYDVTKTPYTGQLIEIKSWYNNETIASTPNHPFLIKDKGYVKSKDVKVGDYLAIRRQGFKNIVPTFHYTVGVNQYQEDKSISFQPTLEDAYMMGYFLGDGWTMPYGNRCCFAISNKDKDRILPKIRKSIKVSEKPNCGTNVSTYQTKSKKWYSVLSNFGHKAHNKCIPFWVFDMPKEYIKEFLQGYKDADGCKREKDRWDFTTTSEQLAYGLQSLFAMFGQVTSLYYQERPETTVIEGRLVNQRNTFSLKTVDGKFAIVDDDFIWVRVRDASPSEDKTDFVYNFSVSEDHTYTVDNIVTHNCHVMSQYTISNDKLWCHMYQRSCDMFLGVPFNIASYSLLTYMLAQVVGIEPGGFIWTGHDVHCYEPHISAIKEQLQRTPYEFPQLELNSEIKNIDDFKYGDFKIVGYKHHPPIKAPLIT